MRIEDNLLNIPQEEYSGDYKTHCLEQYKLYIEMTDRISSRRLSANSFFLTVNTLLIGFVGYVHLGAEKATHFYFLISLAGLILCYTWYRLIRSYDEMNFAKFIIIHAIEKHLPFTIYHAEWEALGRGKDPQKYLPFTKIEKRIPWIFFSLHLFTFLFSLPQKKLWIVFTQ
ncbi:MAG: hypothetical protein AB1487_11150 [Thermodesulfobacteriota bacterium]